MESPFKLIPKATGGEIVVRYRSEVWPGVVSPYDLDGETFRATLCVELNLLPDAVELLKQHHLAGDGVPRAPSGANVTPEEVICSVSHEAFLADRAAIQQAGAEWFPPEAWPAILDEATFILKKARAEGRWRRSLEVRITAEQVDEALQRMRQGARLQTSAPFSSLRYWWDSAGGHFVEQRRTENPYSGELREDQSPIGAQRMRAVLEAIPYRLLSGRLQG